MLYGLIQKVKDRVWSIAARRDPKFPAAERDFIKKNPTCFLCGQPATTAHHTYPVHAYRELEMVEMYWRPVCNISCHFTYCHNKNWSKWVRRETLDHISAVIKRGGFLTSAVIAALIERDTLGPERPAKS